MNSFCRACNKPLPDEECFCDTNCQDEYWGGNRNPSKKMTIHEIMEGCKRLAKKAPLPKKDDSKKTVEQMSMDEKWESLNAGF